MFPGVANELLLGLLSEQPTEEDDALCNRLVEFVVFATIKELESSEPVPRINYTNLFDAENQQLIVYSDLNNYEIRKVCDTKYGRVVCANNPSENKGEEYWLILGSLVPYYLGEYMDAVNDIGDVALSDFGFDVLSNDVGSMNHEIVTLINSSDKEPRAGVFFDSQVWGNGVMIAARLRNKPDTEGLSATLEVDDDGILAIPVLRMLSLPGA